jgi:hypothetical protein
MSDYETLEHEDLGPRRRHGQVRRIVTEPDATYIRLGIPRESAPQDAYFVLRPEAHRNYNAMFSLLLVAFTNDRDLLITTKDPITTAAMGEITSMLVDLGLPRV